MADQIRVNGFLYSWGSIETKIGGERYRGITEVTYGDKREHVKGYGQARHQAPMGRSRGKYSTDPVKIKGFAHAIQAIRAALAAQAEDEISYGNVESLITVSYGETGLGVHFVEIERCLVSADTNNNTESADPAMADLELDCMLIRRDGLTLFDSTGDLP